MPFYEYQCNNCGHALEAMQKINDAPLKKCPQCGKSQLTRLMSAPVFRLKGGGWYETDFKGDADNKKNLADRPEAEASTEAKAGAEAKAGEAAKDSKDSKDSKEAAKPAEKSADKPAADKPAEKTGQGKAAPVESAKKPAPPMSKRGATAAPKPKPKPVRAPVKTAAKAKKRG